MEIWCNVYRLGGCPCVCQLGLVIQETGTLTSGILKQYHCDRLVFIEPVDTICRGSPDA